MSPLAIVMMSIACVLVWGGILVSAIHLVRHPDETSGDLGPEDTALDLDAYDAQDAAPAHRAH